MAALIVIAVIVVFALVVAARSIRVIPQARAGVVERLGRYSRTLEPGLTIITPFVDRVRPLVDLREQVVNFAPQSVITEDNVVVAIETVLYFTITDPRSATYEVANPLQAIEQLTVTTLRNVIGGLTLEETLTCARERQRRAAHRARRGDRQVGDPHQPRRDQVRRPAGGHPDGDGEADARRARPPRRDPHGRRREAGGDPDRRGRQAGRRAARRGRARSARSCAPRAKPRRSTRCSPRSTRANPTRAAQLRIPEDAPRSWPKATANKVFVVPSEFAQAFGGIGEALRAARSRTRARRSRRAGGPRAVEPPRETGPDARRRPPGAPAAAAPSRLRE